MTGGSDSEATVCQVSNHDMSASSSSHQKDGVSGKVCTRLPSSIRLHGIERLSLRQQALQFAVLVAKHRS